MLRLNRVAAEVAQQAAARGATDITGFGLLGHAGEMVEASDAGIEFRARDLPLLPGALALAEAGVFSGGMGRNRSHLDAAFAARGRFHVEPGVPESLVKLLCESETSGGLLFAVEAPRAEQVLEAFAKAAEAVWEVGTVTAEARLALV
jgi:selenide,water dikinase